MKKTPLHQVHMDSKARLVDFGGWHMPVQYSGLSLEHNATRTKAGLFDVSHMGEVLVEGPHAESFLNFLVTNNVSKLKEGHAQYTVMCYENGGVVDDLLIYKRAPSKYLLCVNASNTDKDFAWIQEAAKKFPQAMVKNVSDEFCQIAIQGPLAAEILKTVSGAPLEQIKYYHFMEYKLLGKDAILSRTGYTGEDGFEIYAPASQAVSIWNALMDAGSSKGLIPCGLGARDTLRTEMKFPLYGHEITADTNPLEAGLGWVVKLDKPEDFLAKSVLAKIKAAGITRSLVGIKSLDRAIPRQGYQIFNKEGSLLLGEVTSGTLSPSLGYPIAIGYVKSGHQEIGKELSVQVRDQKVPATIVTTPFYQRLK